MDFSTLSFWYSLLPALAVLLAGNRIWGKNPAALRRFHKGWLLAVSLLLLGLASWLTLGIFLSVMLAAYAGCCLGCRLGKGGKRCLLLAVVPLLLLPLLYYKYAYFIGHGVLGQEWDALKDLIIPIGISFYTFQIISFCIDTLIREKPIPPFIDYMNFGAFFPQIVAGPIERRDDLLPQVQQPALALCRDDWREGVPYVVLGLFFKLALADNLAQAFWEQYTGRCAYIIWINNLLFTFRIYFDFAGYGLVAFGLARCLGIRLRMNFLSPYTAGNISEFWRRWHTSLMLWFRDYIYFPLGGSRTKRWVANIMLVFLISGIWHGAGWNFIIWGGLAGLAMVIHRAFRQAGWHLPGLVGWLLTFGMMVVVWMFFYDTDAALLQRHLELLSMPEAYDAQLLLASLIARKTDGTLAICILALSFLVILAEFLSLRTQRDPYRLFLHPVSCGIMVFLTVWLNPGVQNQFIYFAF